MIIKVAIGRAIYEFNTENEQEAQIIKQNSVILNSKVNSVISSMGLKTQSNDYILALTATLLLSEGRAETEKTNNEKNPSILLSTHEQALRQQSEALREQLEEEFEAELEQKLQDRLQDSLQQARQQMYQDVYKEIHKNLEQKYKAQLSENFNAQVEQTVNSKIEEEVERAVKTHLLSLLKSLQKFGG